jgi:AcrR family transcriptional regulator
MSEKKPQEQRIQEILDAALTCFAAKGYDKTTMDDIVDEAGLTKGGIYWYFKSKRDIFLALLDRHSTDDAIKWAELLKNNTKAGNLIRTGAFEGLKEHIEQSWFLPVIQEMMAESFRDESIREKLYSLFNNEGIYLLMPLLLTGKEPDKEQKAKAKNMATALLAMGYGLTVFYHLSGKKIPFEEIWQEATHALIHGIELPHDDE